MMGKTESEKSAKTKKKNSKQGEVFVLTPDILQKLGISLGDITSQTQYPSQVQQSKTEVIPKETEKPRKSNDKVKKRLNDKPESTPNHTIPQKGKHSRTTLLSNTLSNTSSGFTSLCNNTSNEQETFNMAVPSNDSILNNANKSESSSSILETANLMKKSVFLSPTFSNTEFVNNFQDETSQESSNQLSEINNKQQFIGNYEQNLSNASCESYCSLNFIPADNSKTWELSKAFDNTSPVVAEDEVTDIDGDIPLSKIQTALTKIKRETVLLTKIPKSLDNTTLTPNRKNIVANKNLSANNLIKNVEIEENEGTFTISENLVFTGHKESESHIDDQNIQTQSIKDITDNEALKTNEESQKKDVGDHLILSFSSNSDFQNTIIRNGNALEDSNITEKPPNKTVNRSEDEKKNCKIKIISEEIIDSSQLQEIKKTCSTTQKLHLTPVSIETKITKETSCNGVEDHSENNFSEDNTVKLNGSVVQNGTDLIDKNDVVDTKVKEIADYLSQVIKNRSSGQTLRDNKKKLISSRKNKSNSKLCAQGVEKPGGEENSTIQMVQYSLKYYCHSRKIKKKEKVIFSNKIDIKVPSAVIDCNDISSQSNTTILQEWCFCTDFGKYDVYCKNESYEHIHFWHHQDSVTNESKPDELKETSESDEQGPESAVICWSNIKVDDFEVDPMESNEDNHLAAENKQEHTKIISTSSTSTSIEVKSIKYISPDSTAKSSNGRTNNLKTNCEEIPLTKTSSHANINLIKKNTSDKCKSKKHFTKEIDTPSQSKSDMAKKKITINSISLRKEIITTEKDSIKNEANSNSSLTLKMSPDSIAHRRSTRSSIHESSSIQNSLSNALSVSLTNTSPVKDQPVKRSKKSDLGVIDKLAKNDRFKQSSNSQISRSTNKTKENGTSENKDKADEPKIKIEPVTDHEDLNLIIESNTGIGKSNSNSDGLVTCSICNDKVSNENWYSHKKTHDYLAWKVTEKPLDLDNIEEVKKYLQNISRKEDGLHCSKCGTIRKFAKSYLNHIKTCDGKKTDILDVSNASGLNTTQESVADTTNDSIVESRKAKRQRVDELVTCGVCKTAVCNSQWIEHIRKEHQYMAKRDGEIPLDENNEEEVKNHLYNISKYNGGLICSKCGTSRKYVKVYLDHIKTCNGSVEAIEEDICDEEDATEVICGVCKMSVAKNEWYTHIQLSHRYMAWIEGKPPLNVDDPEEVHDHLQRIAKKVGKLYCWHCNESRRFARVYLQHINLCESSGLNFDREEKNPNLAEDQFECGVCHEIGKKKDWKGHAMSKHYNVAWMVGETPINLKNIYAVEKYLKDYKAKHNTLVCKLCGLSRVSCCGFYAHILTCGKSNEELEQLHNVCEICDKKYICIYKNQHMASHRDAELKKELREREAAIKKEKKDQELTETINGKRRAASKAQKVLAELANGDANIEDYQPPIKKRRYSDVSHEMNLDDGNESGSAESDIDSNISDEENDVPLQESKGTVSKIQRVPFKVENVKKYLKQGFLDFQKHHLTNECLYNEWRHKELRPVTEASQYLPTVTKSCKLKYDSYEWSILNRFDAVKNSKSLVLFTGGCIQCMLWAPEDPVTDSNFYIAVSTHRGTDVPRYNQKKLASHPGLIQIWTLGDLKSVPVFSLGIAHNYGTIWAMDWCPSGSRDVVPSDCVDKTILRLGLLAVACSNGDAYILSVPYPPDVDKREIIICEAEPVVELRLNHSSKKRKYQATSICWTPQKGHSTVIVGYADGTTALYDLNTKSPLQFEKSSDSNMTVIYPFLEKMTENSAISALSVSTTLDGRRAVGGVCSGGATGAGVWSGATPAAELHTALAARAAAPAPLWPAHRLLAEINVSSKIVNEMEWIAGGRRLGAMCTSAGCSRCGIALLAAPPALRLLRGHPAYPDVKKRIIATLRMIPLNKKVSMKKLKDDHVIVVEPFRYKDAVEKYGLEFQMLTKKDNVKNISEEIEQRADRFPLSEVTAAAFCPSDQFHHRLALASHAGVIFVINTTEF